MKSTRGEAILAEAAVRVRDYFTTLPKDSTLRRQFLEEELGSLVQKFVRSETGRRPMVVSSVNIL